MQTTKYDGRDQNRVLAGMATDQTVCARIASRWPDGGLFGVDWADLIGGWCVDHLRQYGRPPGKQIAPIFEAWASNGSASDSVIDAVERFLHYVSDVGAESNDAADHLLDIAGRLFNRVRVQRAIDDAERELDGGDPGAAYESLTALSRVELGPGSLVVPSSDFAVWDQAFSPERQKPLITYPGKLGLFVGRTFRRETLSAIQASDKVGKSWFLMDAAFRAVRSRSRVAYFEAGDLGQDETIMRLGMRATRRPQWKKENCAIPTGFDKQRNPIYRYETFKDNLTPREAFKAFNKVCRGGDRLRLSCHENGTLSADDIQSILDDWARQAWRPDVICIDYADIMAPPAGVRDTLDQIDGTWRALRRLSQRAHALVLTATQAKATAYTARAKTQGRQHFSGRKTKNAEVEAMLGLNQTADEKDKGVWRLNWIVNRGMPYSDAAWVTVAGCLAIGCPVLVST